MLPHFSGTGLQSKNFRQKLLCKVEFTLLKSNFFPAKFPFSKIQEKNLAGKIYFAKEWILLCKGVRSKTFEKVFLVFGSNINMVNLGANISDSVQILFSIWSWMICSFWIKRQNVRDKCENFLKMNIRGPLFAIKNSVLQNLSFSTKNNSGARSCPARAKKNFFVLLNVCFKELQPC